LTNAVVNMPANLAQQERIRTTGALSVTLFEPIGEPGVADLGEVWTKATPAERAEIAGGLFARSWRATTVSSAQG
jgi:hypothetical protein